MPIRISENQRLKTHNHEKQEENSEEMKGEQGNLNSSKLNSEEEQKEENQRSTMRESKKEVSIPTNTVSSSSKRGVGWIIMLMIILFGMIGYNMWNTNYIENRYKRIITNLNEEVDSLNSQIKELSGLQTKVNKITDWWVYTVNYGGNKSKNNSVDWIGERSLGFPNYLSGKNCYILGSKMDGDSGGTIRGYLGKDHNENKNIYSFSTNYEAYVNNSEKKIEITKRDGSKNTNLTQAERNNLYFSLTLLCSEDRGIFAYLNHF